MNINGYDAWKLSGHEDRHEVGTEDGETCGRYPPDDEDMGRARKRPCTGTMVSEDDPEWPGITCDTCGSIS